MDGSNNNIQGTTIIDDNYCAVKITGSNNIFNNSLIINTYNTAVDTGLIHLAGSGNRFTHNWIDVYNITGKVFYSTSEDNLIYDNRLNVSQNSWLMNTTTLTNFSITPQAGIRIWTNGTQVGGNFYANSTGSFSNTCTDLNTDGFCDGIFILSTFG